VEEDGRADEANCPLCQFRESAFFGMDVLTRLSSFLAGHWSIVAADGSIWS